VTIILDNQEKMMKKLIILCVFCLVLTIAAGCAFDELWKDLGGKSTTASAQGSGFTFNTSVGSDGAISPRLDFGTIYSKIFNHKLGDGDMMSLRISKSTLPYGSSSVGELNWDYAAKTRLKKTKIETHADGSITIEIDGLEVVDTESVAKYFEKTLSKQIDAMDLPAQARAFETLTKIREIAASDKEVNTRFNELANMTDKSLDALTAGEDPIDNRMIADEKMFRVLQKKLTSDK